MVLRTLNLFCIENLEASNIRELIILMLSYVLQEMTPLSTMYTWNAAEAIININQWK